FDPYTDVNVYWLTWDSTPGKRISLFDAAPSGVSENIFFTETRHLENDSLYYSGDSNLDIFDTYRVSGEGWIWRYLNAGESATLGFDLPDLFTQGTTTTLKLKIRGTTRDAANPDHHAVLEVNGQEVGEDYFSDREERVLEFSIDNSLLQESTNFLKLHSVGDTQAQIDQFYLDWVELSYPRKFIAKDDVLLFTNEAVETNNFTVSNFSQNQIEVFDITNGRKLINGIVTESSGKFQITFEDTGATTKRYVAHVKGNWQVPKKIAKAQSLNIKSNRPRQADYILITHENFLSAAQRLAAHRESHNSFSTFVVNVQDLYDEFNFGIKHPQAVKDFIQFAYTNWDAPAPTFVVFLGDASWDPKFNNPESVKQDFVPSYGNPVSDNWFVSLDGPEDYLPDLISGRIAVETPDEANVAVDNIIAYEKQNPQLWHKNFLFITGGFNQTERTIFIGQSESLIQDYVVQPPPSGNPLRIYKQTDIRLEGENKDDILNTIDKGVVWVNFVGHAASRTWDLMLGDPGELNNTGKLPFISSMTCHTARFANPVQTSFGEEFIKLAHRGAIAFWGTTGWGYIFQDGQLLQSLFHDALQDTVHTLGKATALARIKLWQNFGGTIINRSTIQQYTLLGDPAVDLTLHEKPDLSTQPVHLTFEPQNPTPQDNVRLTIKYFNAGLAAADSFRIKIFDEFENSQTTRLLAESARPPVGFMDSLTVNLGTFQKVGTHNIKVVLDSNDEINEFDEMNNTIDKFVDIFTSTTFPAQPLQHAVVNIQNPILSVNNPQIFSRENVFIIFQIDTVSTFNSSYLKTSPSTEQGEIQTNWATPGLLDKTTYFWRSRVISGEDSSLWSSTFAFTVNLNETRGNVWQQSRSEQFRLNSLEGIDSSFVNNDVRTGKIDFHLNVISAGHGSGFGNFCQIKVNGEDLSPNKRGFNLVTLNPVNGAVEEIRIFDTFKSQAISDSMAQFLNSLRDETVVLIGIKDDAQYSITESAYQALESLGSQRIRELQYRQSWAMIGVKGAPQGSVPEIGPKYQILSVDDTKFFLRRSSSMTSIEIGPASNWSTLSWEEDLSRPGTDITIDLIAFKASSAKWDTLLSGLTNPVGSDLTTIDAAVYPKLKLIANLSDDDALHSPSLNSWAVEFESVPDLAMAPLTHSAPSDTVFEGEDVTLTAKVFNVGQAILNSADVVFYRSDASADRIQIGNTVKLEDVESNSFGEVSATFNTSNISGELQIFAESDPDDKVVELYEFNNITTTTLFVQKDTLSPNIRVTFDGREVAEGEFVSSNP
ncbi:MAG: C25 family cysteine peptidase, partial [bacterium]